MRRRHHRSNNINDSGSVNDVVDDNVNGDNNSSNDGDNDNDNVNDNGNDNDVSTTSILFIMSSDNQQHSVLWHMSEP